MKTFSFSKRLQSFKYALKGIIFLFQNEHNAWIHVISAISIIMLGWYLEISGSEWIAIILSIGVVLTAEAFNTSIEYIADFIQPNQNKKIERIKDLAAGGVLMAAISSLLVGLIIFLPKIIQLISS